MIDLQRLVGYGDPITLRQVALSLLLAYALTQAVAWTYIRTFRGLSYQRAFVEALALGGLVACALMLSLNNSIAAGLGIAGSLAIIRFRTAMRDPRDMVFVFASMGCGIASGLRAHAVACAGTALFCLTAFTLAWTELGRQSSRDGLLRFDVPAGPDAARAIEEALRAHTDDFALVALRDLAQGERREHAYQVTLSGGDQREPLLGALGTIAGVEGLSLSVQEASVEL